MKKKLMIIGQILVGILCFSVLPIACGMDAYVHQQQRKAECEHHRKYHWPDFETRASCIRRWPELSE